MIEYVVFDNERHFWSDYNRSYSFTGCVIIRDVGQFWKLKGKTHRLEGPAVISLLKINGLRHGIFKAWKFTGQLHRRDGPAIERHLDDGTIEREWWLNGSRVNAQDIFDLLSSEQQEKELWRLHEWV